MFEEETTSASVLNSSLTSDEKGKYRVVSNRQLIVRAHELIRNVCAASFCMRCARLKSQDDADFVSTASNR